METVVLIIMLSVGFSFMLKLTFHHLWGTMAISTIAALFTGLTWNYAAGQSKTQIADWLNNPALMLDTSVILTLDVLMQVTFCVLSAQTTYGDKQKRIMSGIRTIVRWFPGLLIFPVLFALLVEIIFSFPGTDFSQLAWCTASIIFIGLPCMVYLFRILLPEEELRLELMFLTNILIAILGVVATVNGRTAVQGTNNVEWNALTGILAILAAGAITGIILHRFRTGHRISRLSKINNPNE